MTGGAPTDTTISSRALLRRYREDLRRHKERFGTLGDLIMKDAEVATPRGHLTLGAPAAQSEGSPYGPGSTVGRTDALGQDS